MREVVELRIPEELASSRWPASVGERLGESVRKLKVSTADPLFSEIKEADRELRSRGELLITGWKIARKYSRRELAQAELLHIFPKKMFEPAGEEGGTEYDEASACDHAFSPGTLGEVRGNAIYTLATTCGGGAEQTTPLYLDGRRIPKTVDFARTIAGEVVVTAKVRDVFSRHGFTGAVFAPLRLSNRNGKESDAHFQLVVEPLYLSIHQDTRAGGSLFDEGGYGRCPFGHSVGLNLLSEVTVTRDRESDADLMASEQFVGVRQGLLRPHRIMLLSPRAWDIFEAQKLRGLGVEIARMADPHDP